MARKEGGAHGDRRMWLWILSFGSPGSRNGMHLSSLAEKSGVGNIIKIVCMCLIFKELIEVLY